VSITWWAIETLFAVTMIPVLLLMLTISVGMIAIDIIVLLSGVMIVAVMHHVGMHPPLWMWALSVVAGLGAYFGAYAYGHKQLNTWIQAHEPTGVLRYAWPGTGIEGQDAKDLLWFHGLLQRIKWLVVLTAPIAIILLIVSISPPPPVTVMSVSPAALFVVAALDVALIIAVLEIKRRKGISWRSLL
jgi:hypothetical protein